MEKTEIILTNNEIRERFSNETFYLMLSDFTGAMGYWLAANQHRAEVDIDKPLKAFSEYLQQKYFKTHDTVREFTFEQLNTLISEDVFIGIPELLKLNQIDSKDYYDLAALARNIFYMICREEIVQHHKIQSNNCFINKSKKLLRAEITEMISIKEDKLTKQDLIQLHRLLSDL